MQYEELHRRFGTHIAQRVAAELTPSEFEQIKLDDIGAYLDQRAERAQTEYRNWLQHSFHNRDIPKDRMPDIDALHRQWRFAEDLAYLVTLAENIAVVLPRKII